MFQFQINHKDLEFGQMMRCLGPSTTGLFLTGHYLKKECLTAIEDQRLED